MNKQGTENGPVDLLGRDIKVGDVVAYPTIVSRSAAVRIGKVVELIETKQWNGARSWSFRLEYYPESMNWGLYDNDWQKKKERAEERLDWFKSGKPIDPAYLYRRYDWETKKYVEPNEAAVRAELIKLYERDLKKANKELAAGPKPRVIVLTFPEKSVVITDIYKKEEK